LVQRENSKKRPWAGHFVKLERHPGHVPVLHTYDYWLSSPKDPKLVSAASTVAVLDFDNTLARGWILGPWMQCLAENDTGEAGPATRRLAELFTAYNARPGFGHDRLATEAGQIYADAMKGVPVQAVQPLAEPFVADYLGPRGQLSRSSRTLIDGLRHRGLRPVLITGAPGEVTESLMRELNIERCFPLMLEIDNGIFTGHVVSNRGVSHEKAAACDWLEDQQECELVVAIGDSDGDRPMWRRAQISIQVGGVADRADVTRSGVDMEAPLDEEFWELIPTASWLSCVSQADLR
jgi:phosphoserine phosphatase